MEAYFLWKDLKYRMLSGLEPYDGDRLAELYTAMLTREY
jgi:hypothetical protein